MYHWADGLEIDLRDDNGNGMSLTFAAGGIKLFKAVNNVTTLFHSSNWDA